jgi:TonB family protein
MVRKLAAGTFAALTLFAATAAHAQSVVVQHGNLVYQSASGATETLTETGADGNPALSPDGTLIAFTRLRADAPMDSKSAVAGPLRDVYVMRLADRVETRLVTAAYASTPEGELSGIKSLAFSPDGSTLYFNTAAWVTSGAIHAVSVQSGRERFVTSGNTLTVVSHGKYLGCLLVTQHRYLDGNGSWDPYVLVSPEGKTIKILGEFDGDYASAEEAALQSAEMQGNANAPVTTAADTASAGYTEKVQRLVRSTIVWSGETRDLETVIAVHCTPTGTLLSATITRSSGNAPWDTAALRAVQRSDPMPLDINGETPKSFSITLRPPGE